MRRTAQEEVFEDVHSVREVHLGVAVGIRKTEITALLPPPQGNGSAPPAAR